MIVLFVVEQNQLAHFFKLYYPMAACLSQDLLGWRTNYRGSYWKHTNEWNILCYYNQEAGLKWKWKVLLQSSSAASGWTLSLPLPSGKNNGINERFVTVDCPANWRTSSARNISRAMKKYSMMCTKPMNTFNSHKTDERFHSALKVQADRQ